MKSQIHALKEERLIACLDCDLLHEITDILPGQDAVCTRCGFVLYQHKYDSLNRTLALVITGLICFIPANVYPILSLRVLGISKPYTLFDGVVELIANELWFAAFIVLISSIFMPLVNLLLLSYMLIPLKLNVVPGGGPWAFRMHHLLEEWGMLEIYMLGILLAIIKLKDIGDLEPGIGLYSFIVLMVVNILAAISFDPRIVWDRSAEKP